MSDKLAFLVGFIFIIMSLFDYTSKLDIKVDFLFYSCTINQLMIVAICLLGLSLYFYTINFIRYDFPSLLKYERLKYLELIGHYFFHIAFFFYPLFILLVAIITHVIKVIENNYSFINDKLDIIARVAIALNLILFIATSILSIYSINIKMIHDLKESKKNNMNFYLGLAKANLLLNQYESIPNLLFESMCEWLKLKLIKKYGVSIDNISRHSLISLAYHKYKILSNDQYQFIKSLEPMIMSSFKINQKKYLSNQIRTAENIISFENKYRDLK